MHSTTNNADSANASDFNPAVDVPQSLREHLIATESPQEVYLDRVHASERRLRLLHRRFLNQITYGCKNPRCDVPTCFSYRKRLSGAAIRPYTDVSARALAANCVEQYSSHGRDVGRGFRREHGKTKATPGSVNGGFQEDGLCRNEPVIPWYADPDEYLAKIKAAASRDSRPRRYSTPRKQSITSEQPRRDSNGQQLSLTAVKPKGDTRLKQRSEQETAPQTQQAFFMDEAEMVDEGSSLPQVTFATGANKRSDHPSDAVLGLRATHPHAPKRDHASFAQSLFSRPELQALHRRPDTKPIVNGISGISSTNHDADSYDKVLSEQQSGASITPRSPASKPVEPHLEEDHRRKCSTTSAHSQHSQHSVTGTTLSAYTFRLLPPSAILWLRNALIRHGEQSEQSAQKPAPPTELQRFVEQSLYYVLSDARRLMSSASTWDDYGQIRHVEDATCIQHGLAQSMNGYLPRTANVIHAVEAVAARRLNDEKSTGSFKSIHPRRASVVQVCIDLVQFVPAGQGQPRIMHHMVQALEQGFVAPSWMKHLKIAFSTTSHGTSPLSNDEVAHLITLVLNVASTMPYLVLDPDPIVHEREPRRAPGLGVDEIYRPPETNRRASSRSAVFDVQSGCDRTEILGFGFTSSLWPYDDDVSELFTAIANLISFRIALDGAKKAQKTNSHETAPGADIVEAISKVLRSPIVGHFAAGMQLLNFMLAVLFVKWDRCPIIQRASPVGGALEMLKGLYQIRETMGFNENDFMPDFLVDALDEYEVPYEWLSFKPDAIHMHILQFSFLFPPMALVRYFRSLNFKIMKLSHEKALEVYTTAKTQMIHARWPQPRGMEEVVEKVRPHMNRYFVMTIRREHVLEDAIGQIWQRERQEFMRPLRVKLGEEDGEEGLDHGGVQQEFFRLVFAEAFDTQFGMFTTDPTTRMTWFQPGALEPLYKFEALGILMSLAVFNGVTIPITMPLAFYRKVLGLKVKKIEHIADGWPELANGFQQMLNWDEGDVGDVIGRTYEFIYEAFGTQVSIDMSKMSAPRPSKFDMVRPQTSPSRSQKSMSDLRNDVKTLDKSANFRTNEVVETSTISNTSSSISSEAGNEAPLVTNGNRDDFVKDYIKHLTDITIAPQFTAFLRGLHTLLSPRSLALFSPPVLKSLVEGLPTSQPLNVNQWKATTELEGFLSTDPLISWFWDILANDFSQPQLRALLAFVTASDRIPVGGWSGVIFIIQRNGDEDGRLPTSQTCYGRLLLPEYSSREVLKGRLEWAVDNSWGFWMA